MAMANTYEVTRGKRVANWITARMAGLGVGNFIVLTTTGQRSGKPRSVTLALISDDDGDYLVCPYGDVSWVRNVRAQPEAIIKSDRMVRDVTLVEVTGAKPELVKQYYDRESFARQFMEVPGDATVEDFAGVPHRFPVFRIEDRE